MLNQLPETYVIPKFHNSADKKDFDDNYFILFKPTNTGKPIVETEEGTFTLSSEKDIPKLFKHKYNWTYSRFHEWQCFFRFFSSDQLFNLRQVFFVEFGDYKLHWIPGTGKMRLERNGNTRSSKYLINTYPWCSMAYNATCLDQIKVVVDKLLELNKYIPINPISPAATAKDLILTVSNQDFALFNRIPLEDTKFLHSCYVGPRMESRLLGTIEGADNVDMNKAYLRALGRCPSIDPRNLLKEVRGAPYCEDALPQSGYEVEVTVPQYYDKFAPLPLRWQGRTPYPHGTFRTRVNKKFLELIKERGDIPFTIIDSVQLIPGGPLKYPYKKFTDVLEAFENQMGEKFYPLNLKVLHYPIQGHMLHIHKNVDLIDGRIWYEAGNDYNPGNAALMQAMVATTIWGLAQDSDVEAIRVDAVSGYNLTKNEGFKQESTGLMTFLTPGLKDKPGRHMYRDLIHANRDYPAVRVRVPVRYGVQKAWSRPTRIGSITTVVQELFPLAGNRDTGEPLDIKRIGRLLDERIEIPIPKVPTEQFQIPNKRVAPWWIDEYLYWFPQTKT